jgi:hypothetical protein
MIRITINVFKEIILISFFSLILSQNIFSQIDYSLKGYKVGTTHYGNTDIYTSVANFQGYLRLELNNNNIIYTMVFVPKTRDNKVIYLSNYERIQFIESVKIKYEIPKLDTIKRF